MSYIKYKKIEHDLISDKKRAIRDENYEKVPSIIEELNSLKSDPREYLLKNHKHHRNSLEGMNDRTDSMTLFLVLGKIRTAQRILGISTPYSEINKYLSSKGLDIFEDSPKILKYINEDIGEDSTIEEKMEYFVDMCTKCDINGYIT